MKAPGRLAAAAFVLATSSRAAAFCRTTSCDPNDPGPDCRTVGGCLVGGLELYWKGRCVTFTVHEDGSSLRGIGYPEARDVIADGYRTWVFSDCGGGGRPSLDVIDLGTASCRQVEYNTDAPNANVWMFRDDRWPYPDNGHTLALTTITFNVDTGEIFDADVEINSADNVLTIDGPDVRSDLRSIVTHEAGHFLGLSHSANPDATMYARYREGDTSLRSLAQDDVDGVCSIYPPERTEPLCLDEPRHGFSRKCAEKDDGGGCACRQPSRGASVQGLLGLAVATALLGARRRRRGSNKEART